MEVVLLICELVLKFFSHAPSIKSSDNDSVHSRKELDEALSILEREIPDFSTLIRGKRVVDFGCGRGLQSIALAQKYDCQVVGVDSNEKTLGKAKMLCERFETMDKCQFVSSIQDVELDCVDIVISQDSFEHFSHPETVLETMINLIGSDGIIIITFGPPWFAPYGSHMHFFCTIPWVNILFPERAIMGVRSGYVDDGATKFEDVESGLNRMTLKKFETILKNSALKTRYRKYTPVKNIDILSKIPFVRELFVNHVTVILSKNNIA